MADDVINEIENEIRDNKVMIYMKGTPSFPQCGFSATTVEIFEELGRPFNSVDILSNPAKRERRSFPRNSRRDTRGRRLALSARRPHCAAANRRAEAISSGVRRLAISCGSTR